MVESLIVESRRHPVATSRSVPVSTAGHASTSSSSYAEQRPPVTTGTIRPAQRQATRTQNESPAPPGGMPAVSRSEPARPQARTGARTRLNQISCEVTRCKGRDRVTCDLSLTSEDRDRSFHIDPKTSFVIDDSGNQYKGTEAQIANRVSEKRSI